MCCNFRGLRAVGAFLVFASLAAGEVHGVSILSKAGQNCTVLSPFGQRGVVVKDGSGAPLQTRRVTIETAAGLWQFETAAVEMRTLHVATLPM